MARAGHVTGWFEAHDLQWLRRTLLVLVFAATIVVGIVALALIVSQTPWFHDWLRRYVVREAKQYVNGELRIGSLGGNLFYGIELGDVSLEVNGQPVVGLKRLEVKYSIGELVASGITVREILLEQPVVHLVHDARGWNVGRLVKAQRREAEREGPGRPITLPDIEIIDGRVTIDDRAPSPAYHLPARVDRLYANAGFEYEPVHYSVTLDRFSFAATDPSLTVTQLTGRVATREDTLHVDDLTLRTGDSAVTIDGVVRNYLQQPSLQLTVTSPRVSMPEVGRLVEAADGYTLHPSFTVKATGPLERLALETHVKSEAGTIDGTVTTDVKGPDLGVSGTLDVASLNLAPLLKDPAQRSDITGKATVDLRVAGRPEAASALERMRGTFAFTGPTVVAAGYRARDVQATGTIDGRRIGFDGRARAYGAAATAKGSIVTPARAGAPLQYDIAGRASHVDLRALPARLSVPRLATDLNASAYHVKGRTGHIEGTATLGRSTVEGGTFADGTIASFTVAGKDVRYASRGSVADLDLERIGRAFKIDALNRPDYASRIDAQFDVTGEGTAVPEMRLDATATITDSAILGGTVPRLAVEAHLADGGIRGSANGELRGFDPARISGNDKYAGTINATLDTRVSVADVSAPITPDAITADGAININESEVGGLRIDSAVVRGHYADRRGELQQLTVKSADVSLQASGPIALDRSGASNLAYHVEASDLAALAKLAGQPIGGHLALDGTLTGNAAALQTTGTLNGANLSFEKNNALDLNSTYTVRIPDLRLADARVESRTTATFIAAAGLKINRLTASTTYQQKRLEFQTLVQEETRELEANGSVIFHPDHQEIHLPSLALRTQGVEWRTAPGTAPAVQYGANRIDIENLKLVNGAQTIAAHGAIALNDAEAPATLTVEARNVDIAQVQRLALQDRGLTGTLSANATLVGSIKAPAVKGHVEIHDGGFREFKYQSFVADAGYDQDTVTLDARLQQAPGVALTARGTLPISALRPTPPDQRGHVPAHGADTIDVRVQSTQIDLGLVQGFTTALTNVTGTLQADVRVTGSGEDPHMQGYIDIRNGAFAVVPAKTSYTGLTTRIELQPDRVRIPRLEIKDEHGRPMTIQGDLALHARAVGAVNVSIDSRNFQVMDNDLGEVNVTTNLQLTGEVRRPKLTGEISLGSARIEVDKVLLLAANPYAQQGRPDIITAEPSVAGTTTGADVSTRRALEEKRAQAANAANAARAAQPAPAAAAQPKEGVFSALALDVRLRAPDDLVLRGSSLRPGGAEAMQIGNVNATIGADLRVRKQPDGPITIVGTVNTVRGFYEFQGRRFTLQRDGTIRFLGLPEINPSLDVTAERVIPNSGVTVEAHVTGSARAPELELTSTPPLDEADILALIIFNRSINELGTGERASLAETAGGIASGFIAAPLGRSIGRALDVDLFEITTSDPTTGEVAGGVTLGKQVSEAAFFRFRQQFGPRSFTEFMLDYQLADFLRLQVTTAPEAANVAYRLNQRRVERAGIDLIFFFSY